MHIKKRVFYPITANNASFHSSEIAVGESFEPLIKIEGQHPRIFTKPIYHQQKIPNSLQVIYVREGVYERLQEALSVLPKIYSLVLYDGYRPFQVQQYLFTHFAQEIAQRFPQLSAQEIDCETRRYVAFPSLDCAHLVPHLTGGAVDITLGDINGHALNLGTAFDEISAKSATRYFEQFPNENHKACTYRRLLYNCMTMAGFTNYSEEWWHYDYNNIAWARRVQAQSAIYGAMQAVIHNHYVKEFNFI